ncbi:MAG: 3-isopropylmalate dehydrogenase [Gemmatimonadaceae bacterium]|nr:3-isopropylmalate dehydrogenase [Gemmatimonadaceae bacterium]
MHARIALLAGDGVGPEVAAEAVKVLTAVGRVAGHRFEFAPALVGGAAIDATGSALPAATRDVVAASDATLLGAVGGPRWNAAPVRPESGLLELRAFMGVYANLRPVPLFDAGRRMSPLRAEVLDGVDLVVVRELTGGLYYGDRHRGGDVAWETCRYSELEVARVVRVAARLAITRRRKLTSIDKANVLETSRLWRQVTERVMRDEFPDVTLDHLYVDAAAMFLVREPARFDVLVTENLFGDILSDESSVLAGSIGLLPSASLGEAVDGRPPAGLYEPIHGSAPDIAGRGIANPIGMILSTAMMLRHSFALDAEARLVEAAVAAALDDGWLTPDVASAERPARSTADVGSEIARRIEAGYP